MASNAAFIGILILDTHFPRIPGDVGNPSTFDYPVKYSTIHGASVDKIVRPNSPSDDLSRRFVEAARHFEAQGAVGLITSCGFLSVLQNEIAQSVRIPVITSSLNLIPLLQLSLNNRPIGIITADQNKLSENALRSAQVDPQHVHIAGMQTSAVFSNAILNAQNNEFDSKQLCQETLAVAKTLQCQFPKIAAIVLECTNLQPYAAQLKQQLNLPVFGIVDGANFLWQGSNPLIFR